jgi:hypothetical protein
MYVRSQLRTSRHNCTISARPRGTRHKRMQRLPASDADVFFLALRAWRTSGW